MAKHNELGKKGEAAAAHYLYDKGYSILEQNYRYQRAEVDIIALFNSTVIFIEVKTRSNDFFGLPEDAVHSVKEAHLQKAADAYIDQHNIESEIRFDIISVSFEKEFPQFHHIEDAFFPSDH